MAGGLLWAQGDARRLADEIEQAGLDPEFCFRVRNLRVARPDLSLYLTEGVLIFGRPVRGERYAAVFSGEVEGGDAEVLVIPPSRSERRSLVANTESPTLNEHFRNGLLLFGGRTGSGLIEQLQREGAPLDRELGKEYATRYGPVVRELSAEFALRLLQERLAPVEPGLLFVTLVSPRLGPVDILYDPLWSEPLLVGTSREGSFTTWTQFRPRRVAATPDLDPGVRTLDVAIDAVVRPDLELEVVSRQRLRTGPRAVRVLPFAMSRRMRLAGVRINGDPVEFFQRPEDRRSPLRVDDAEVFLAVPAAEIPADTEVEVAFEASGKVIEQTPSRVYFVRARSSWYPHVFIDLAPHRMRFRSPKGLTLVLPGEFKNQRVEGETVVSEYEVRVPVRMVGFNLGPFEKAVERRPGQTVEVLVDPAMEPPMMQARTSIVPPGSRRGGQPVMVTTELVKPPLRKQELAREVADSLAYFTSLFGPPPLDAVRVSPVPGRFGQGFPGLIYLSTASFVQLAPGRAGPVPDRQPQIESELFTAHEAAHQWWGNLVYATERADEWLMEALANYSALLYIEKRHGKTAVDRLLDRYRENLLERGSDGNTVESTGPIAWGVRLQTTRNPVAWQRITYEKGTWILHMLRVRMGRERFVELLARLVAEYPRKVLTAEAFRLAAAAYLPARDPDRKLELFFEQWVYGTGIPRFRFKWSIVKGAEHRVQVALMMEGVEEDFAIHVPLVVRTVTGRGQTRWVQATPDPIELTIDAGGPVRSVVLDPEGSVLARRD
jgi:hypothetical protein